MKHYNDKGVELTSIAEALIEAKAGNRLGYSPNLHYSGTPIYSWLQFARKDFGTPEIVGTVHFFEASVVREAVEIYIAKKTGPKIPTNVKRQIDSLIQKAKADKNIATMLIDEFFAKVA